MEALITTLLIYFAAFSSANGQLKNWTRISGDNIPNSKGVYKAKGFPGLPAARIGGLTWTDKAGNLWLFGGEAGATDGNWGVLLNDLWKFDHITHEWTWIDGQSRSEIGNSEGNIPLNHSVTFPINRAFGTTWTDPDGELWLYGGRGEALHHDYQVRRLPSHMDDLWAYNPETNQWTWLTGTGDAEAKRVYGTKGIPSKKNRPGGRMYATGWAGSDGTLWLFGGSTLDPETNDYLTQNDLWRFDISDQEWTWLSGDSVPNVPGRYGIKGKPSARNVPGARERNVAWKDAAENFWLFGGEIIERNAPTHIPVYNDLWTYNPATPTNGHG